jgi:transcription antitermination factor NusG
MEVPHFWCAVATKARHEAVVSKFLQATGIEQFLPTSWIERRWSDRVKAVEVPLFPGYLFCRIAPQTARTVLAVPGVSRILRCGASLYPVPDAEVEAIQSLVLSGLPASPGPYLTQGDPVRVTGGPLKGQQGILVKIKKQYRFVVSINLLQRSVFVDLDAASVEAL